MSLANKNLHNLFFFNQKEVNERRKRPKKQFDEKTLNNLLKKFNNAFPESQTNFVPEKSLSDRLGDLITNKSRQSSAVSQSSAISRRQSAQNPNAYTDTRLQGLRFLTEDMIKELERILIEHTKYDIVPLLPGFIVHDWHSDWADLTDKCSYIDFPIWRTRVGRDSMLKRIKNDRVTSASAQNDTDRSVSSRKSKHSKSGHLSTLSRLTSISEKKNGSMCLSHDLENVSTTNIRRNTESHKNFTQITESSIINLQKSRNDMGSRMTQTTTTMTTVPGCSVNYQLSNYQYKENGWTVIAPSEEDKTADALKKVLTLIKNSMEDIEIIRSFNEKYGLTFDCRYRLYGEYRREQLEKYKTQNRKPRKSQFCLSIIRGELPKLLDVDQIIQDITNPILSLTNTSHSLRTQNMMSNSRNLVLTSLNEMESDFSSKQTPSRSSLQKNLAPPLYNTKTNDGTNIIHYPTGQVAIVSANVFGFYIDNLPINQTANQSINHSINQSFSSNGQEIGNCSNIRATNTERGLSSHNIKNSYTTVVYGLRVTKGSKISNNTPLSSYSNQNSIGTEKSEFKNLVNTFSQNVEQKILAIITANGSCVCYQDNGMPNFICNDIGGYLCNKEGCITFQWKWSDLQLKEYENLTSKLSVNLNEYILLEYRNPFNIKIKYSCNKETMVLDVGSIKENQSRINDFINRTVLDFPMKSTLGNLKLVPSARGATILTYKQQQTQQTSGRKTSISFNSSVRRDSRIDKLLDMTVSFKDIPVMKDLLTIQKKIRNIFEDWKTHCRSSLKILSPELYIFPGSLKIGKESHLNNNHSDFHKIIIHKKKSSSVLGFVTSRSNDNSSLSKSSKSSHELNLSCLEKTNNTRSKSAVLVNRAKKLTKQHLDLIKRVKNFKTQYSKRHIKQLDYKTNDKEQSLNKIFGSFKSFSMTNLNQQILTFKPTPLCIDAKKMPSFFRQNTMPNISHKSTNNIMDHIEVFHHTSSYRLNETNKNTKDTPYYTNEKLSLCCPNVLHVRLALGQSESECKCRKQIVPFIHDIEYDILLKIIPTEQLVVIAVVDSGRNKTNFEVILENTYTNYNRNRIQPCKESIKDDTRFFRYDIKNSTNNADHSQPLLVSRHNVSVGMILIYQNTNLVFCDNIFNGYGFSQKDFLKQIRKSKEDSKEGKFLPNDFRFNYDFNHSDTEIILKTEKKLSKSTSFIVRNENPSDKVQLPKIKRTLAC